MMRRISSSCSMTRLSSESYKMIGDGQDQDRALLKNYAKVENEIVEI